MIQWINSNFFLLFLIFAHLNLIVLTRSSRLIWANICSWIMGESWQLSHRYLPKSRHTSYHCGISACPVICGNSFTSLNKGSVLIGSWTSSPLIIKIRFFTETGWTWPATLYRLISSSSYKASMYFVNAHKTQSSLTIVGAGLKKIFFSFTNLIRRTNFYCR